MKRALAALLLGWVLAGCNLVSLFGEPKPPSLTVDNRTDRHLVLYYERGLTEYEDIGVAPHTTSSFYLAFRLESATCANGYVVARDGDVDVARINQPCAGQTWTIGGSPSESPDSS